MNVCSKKSSRSTKPYQAVSWVFVYLYETWYLGYSLSFLQITFLNLENVFYFVSSSYHFTEQEKEKVLALDLFLCDNLKSRFDSQAVQK